MTKDSAEKKVELVSSKQLALEWAVSVSTVKRICEHAGIPVYRLGYGRNGTVRYRRDDIQKYLESCRI